MSDVIVIGGGVVGLSIAYELSGRGVGVTVLDQGPLGREASWAGAGMLPPANPERARSPGERLRGFSHRLWSGLSERLRAETGIDNGYRKSGGLEVRFEGTTGELDEEIAAHRLAGVDIASLSPKEALECEPRLSTNISAGYRLSEMAQVRNPRHLKAMLAGCAARGVRFLPGTPVHDFDRHGEKIVGVQTPSGVLHAGQFVVAAGAWSPAVLERAGCAVKIAPLRGQIVLLQSQPLPIRHIVQVGKQYLVPRPDGRVLIGSTEDAVGFNKGNTAEGVNGLLSFAKQIVPCLAEATFERAWAGLRPRSADGLPYLGRIPGLENLFAATGHFRDGLQLSPITAELISATLLGEEPCTSLDDFRCDRHSTGTVKTGQDS